MHMADALLSTAVSGTMYVASAAAAGYSFKKLNDELKAKVVVPPEVLKRGEVLQDFDEYQHYNYQNQCCCECH